MILTNTRVLLDALENLRYYPDDLIHQLYREGDLRRARPEHPGCTRRRAGRDGGQELPMCRQGSSVRTGDALTLNHIHQLWKHSFTN